MVWIEGPPGDSDVTAWNSLTYKVGDASGGFQKPVFTIEYGSGREQQVQLAEAHGNGGLMVTMWSAKDEPTDPTAQTSAWHARFVSGPKTREWLWRFWLEFWLDSGNFWLDFWRIWGFGGFGNVGFF